MARLFTTRTRRIAVSLLVTVGMGLITSSNALRRRLTD
jgi:hypothetical protein